MAAELINFWEAPPMEVSALARVMGNVPGVDYAGLLPGYVAAARAAGCTTPDRAAMWAAQLGHESAGLRYMEEIADGSAYEGRKDLGNLRPGDGRRFKGRGPIQLTGRSNYAAFTLWARRQGHADIDFTAEPHRLSEPRWGFLAASYYWTVARPDINALADRRDLDTVTRRINGGTNGLADRRRRYELALSMGTAIVPTTEEGSSVRPVEKRLEYSRTEIAQDTYYWCGPATGQTIIRARTGQLVGEATLAAEMGTTVNGTNGVGQIARVLNDRIGGGWTVASMPNDPPRPDEKEQLWERIVGSIEGGVGVAANIWVPPSNYPRPSYTSTQALQYSGGFIRHYLAVMGYAIDTAGQRHVWLADSGFAPFGSWVTFDQFATMIPPREYAYAADWQHTPDKEISMSEADRIIDFIKGFVGPIGSDTKDIRQQLTGGRDAGQYPGWPQLGQTADGANLTLVDAVAALRRDLDNLTRKVEGQ